MNKLRIIIVFGAICNYVSAQQPFRCGDTLTDVRDGKKYPTVLIGTQCWISRNINAGTQVQYTNQADNNLIEKTCYQNKKENCDTLGGLYTWGEARQYSKDTAGKVQGVCPLNWHIATVQEWKAVYNTAGNVLKLKAGKTNIPKWDGTNETGFTAVPAGLAYHDVFGRKGDWAIFWTATPANPDYAWSIEMDNDYISFGTKTGMVITNTYLTLNAFSVRCIKD